MVYTTNTHHLDLISAILLLLLKLSGLNGGGSRVRHQVWAEDTHILKRKGHGVLGISHMK